MRGSSATKPLNDDAWDVLNAPSLRSDGAVPESKGFKLEPLSLEEDHIQVLGAHSIPRSS
jgi:hypothetical protein